MDYIGILRSEHSKCNKNYHLSKTIRCNKNGIRLIHIFEDEWKNKQEIVKSNLKGFIGTYDNECASEQCETKEVTVEEALKFQKENHIQGQSKASRTNVGLFFKSELVFLMSFAKTKFNGNVKWEIVRTCPKLGWNVKGAEACLLNHFEQTYSPNTLVATIDRRWNDGSILKRLGFKLSFTCPPNVWFVKHGCTFIREPRSKFQNNKLPENYFRIWDCGSFVFEKDYC